MVQGDVVIKTDQELAIIATMEEVGRVRAAVGGGKSVVEQGLVGSSGSNGMVERAIRSSAQQSWGAVEARWAVRLRGILWFFDWLRTPPSFSIDSGSARTAEPPSSALRRVRYRVRRGGFMEAQACGWSGGEVHLLVGWTGSTCASVGRRGSSSLQIRQVRSARANGAEDTRGGAMELGVGGDGQVCAVSLDRKRPGGGREEARGHADEVEPEALRAESRQEFNSASDMKISRDTASLPNAPVARPFSVGLRGRAIRRKAGGGWRKPWRAGRSSSRAAREGEYVGNLFEEHDKNFRRAEASGRSEGLQPGSFRVSL